MAEYTNARSYAVELSGGRMLPPGATANIDPAIAHNLALITAQDLVLYDPSTAPEDPDDLYALVPRRVFAAGSGSDAVPTANRGGDIILGGDGVDRRVNAAGEVSVFRATAPAAGSIGQNHWWPEANQTAILAAAAAARDAGGGIVHLPVGSVDGDWAPISMPAGLPFYQAVTYIGVPPWTIKRSPDVGSYEDSFRLVGGTVLSGNGTGFGVYGNTTDQVTPPEPIGEPNGNAGIYNAGLINVGITNYQDGIRAGARNLHGLNRCKLENVWVSDCTRYAIFLETMMEVDMGWVFSCESPMGMYFGAGNQAPADTNMGNSVFRNVFHRCLKRFGADSPAEQKRMRKQRGFQFRVNATAGGAASAVHSGPNAQRVQVNSDPRTVLAVAATATNGSANLTVPDGTEFEREMPVWIDATANGFLAERIYIVRSVSGNTITIAPSTTDAATVATGSGTVQVRTKGHALCSMMPAEGSGTNSVFVSAKFTEIDLEGDASVGLYLERVAFASFQSGSMTPDAARSVVGRYCRGIGFKMDGLASMDFDESSAINGCTWNGTRTSEWGHALAGLGERDDRNALGLDVGGRPAAFERQIEDRGGWLYPGAGFGEPTTVWTGDVLYLAGLPHRGVGTVVFGTAAAAPATFHLPAITDDRAAISGGFGSSGIRYRIFNANTTHSVTVQSNGGAAGETHNKTAGRWSTVIPPGGWAEFLASYDTSATNFFWLVRGTETRRIIGPGGTPFASARWTAAAGFRTPCYYRDAAGVIHIEGTFQGVGASTVNDTIFALPAGYAPSGIVTAHLLIHSLPDIAHDLCYIQPGGQVQVARGITGGAIASLDASFLPA